MAAAEASPKLDREPWLCLLGEQQSRGAKRVALREGFSLGNHGIFAGFGSAAVDNFSVTIAAATRGSVRGACRQA